MTRQVTIQQLLGALHGDGAQNPFCARTEAIETFVQDAMIGQEFT